MFGCNPPEHLANTIPDPPPETSHDPAYAKVGEDMTYLTSLQIIMSGGVGGGVDWPSVRGIDCGTDADAREKKAKSSIGFVLGMLRQSRLDFQKLATEQEPSKKYITILETAVKVRRSRGLDGYQAKAG